MSEQITSKTNKKTAHLATIPNALTLRNVALIGVFGTAETKHALLRLTGGRIRRVGVGDTVSQNRIVAISDEAVIFNDFTGTRTLTMPQHDRKSVAAA